MEIERKWLIKSFPKAEHVNHCWILQSYLTIHDDCEARVRQSLPAPDHYGKEISRYKFTYKQGNGLSRLEVEKELTENVYQEALSTISYSPITKDYYTYFINGYKVEVSKVDSNWFYAEVEFKSEEEANAYQFPWPELVIEEVTNSNRYKMKNYWKETRLHRE